MLSLRGSLGFREVSFLFPFTFPPDPFLMPPWVPLLLVCSMPVPLSQSSQPASAQHEMPQACGVGGRV